MICEWCKQEMTDLETTSCIANTEVEFPDGKVMNAVPYLGERCHDCNVTTGGYHHPGCDMERCPRCDGQLISCGCLDEENDEDDTESDKELEQSKQEEQEEIDLDDIGELIGMLIYNTRLAEDILDNQEGCEGYDDILEERVWIASKRLEDGLFAADNLIRRMLEHIPTMYLSNWIDRR